MPTSPEGYLPYEKPDFPPRHTAHLANGIVAVSVTISIWLYQADSVAFMIGLVFGAISNLHLHESMHYVALSKLGYIPTYEWPNHVWVPDAGLSTKEGVISLAAPQILTVIYLVLLLLSQIKIVDFMIIVALIFNLGGGLRDIMWTVRRLTWPEGHLVMVSSEGREFVCFPE